MGGPAAGCCTWEVTMERHILDKDHKPARVCGVAGAAICAGMLFAASAMAGVPPTTTTTQAAPAARSAPVAGQTLTLDCNGTPMVLTLIPKGEFVMGDGTRDLPRTRVVVEQPFYMGIYEVTQAQYQAVMGENPSRFKGVEHPVESVTWLQAAEFCRRLSAMAKKPVRLPTEKQWEYACRAGTTTTFFFGENAKDMVDFGRCIDSPKRVGRPQPRPVGGLKPNPWGLYDMYGNVAEYCCTAWLQPFADWNGEETNPSQRALRGGSFADSMPVCTSTVRWSCIPDRTNAERGFRVIVAVRE